MEGVSPDVLELIKSAIGRTISGYSRIMGKSVQDAMRLTDEQRATLETPLKEFEKKSLEAIEDEVSKYTYHRFIRPIILSVGALPKDEMAAMAEALVNLTSFRRRISLDSETVGGPIDVAVISKGDGFVWIRRKHYFRPELNPGFMARYQSGNGITPETDK